MQQAKIILRGIVQGVGFRPFVKRTALKYDIKGLVENREFGVKIIAQAEINAINKFLKDILENAPDVSTIVSHHIEYLDSHNKEYDSFSIAPSRKEGKISALIPPDIATCKVCAEEIMNEKDRHFEYPFTNCTNCGPRFSIIKSIPYDRNNTTMKKFIMCEDCDREYTTIADRRYHAQPNACPKCGPELRLVKINEGQPKVIKLREQALEKTIELLRAGEIVAIKGIGGFHLVCDARNEKVVGKLRELKHRPQKPFALMARNIDEIREYCHVTSQEENMLAGQQKPIVLLEKINHTLEYIAPGVKDLGFMLPYTPLHYLLFRHFHLLIFTSGNISEEALENRDLSAYKNLSRITKYYLSYNREIFNRIDDSIVTFTGKQAILIRKARGFIPKPIKLPEMKIMPEIFAAGADMKGSFGLTKGDIFLGSQYLGDLGFVSNSEFYEESLGYFKSIFEMEPEVVIADAHPNYFSHQFAKEYAQENRRSIHFVQHHKAHIYSVMAENRLRKALGISFDGTGYGDDGQIWGGECFIIDKNHVERFSHLAYKTLISGENVAKEPWRMSLIYLHSCCPEKIDRLMPASKFPQRNLLVHQLERADRGIMTSSMGRLFDAVASILDVCHYNTYEGEAPMKLEALADENCERTYDYDIHNGEINVNPMIKEIVHDRLKKISKEEIASKFHFTIAQMIYDLCKKMSAISNIKDVALSGGVFQNSVLVKMVYKRFTHDEFRLYFNEKVPPNDAGVALGQLYSYLLEENE